MGSNPRRFNDVIFLIILFVFTSSYIFIVMLRCSVRFFYFFFLTLTLMNSCDDVPKGTGFNMIILHMACHAVDPDKASI